MIGQLQEPCIYVCTYNKLTYLRVTQQQHIISTITIKRTIAPPTDAPIIINIGLLESSSSAGILVVTKKMCKKTTALH